MRKLKINSATRVAFIYFVFSVLWITLSDTLLLKVITDAEVYQQISTMKGTFFVLVSSFVIYFLVNKEIRNLKIAYQNIYSLEQFDTLTNLKNRASLEKEFDRIFKEKIQVSVLMADVNGLRIINEVFSHEKGDLILKDFSKLLIDLFPKETFISRFGGDEFIIILYDCTYTEVGEKAKLLIDKVEHNTVDGMKYSISLGYSSTCSLEHNVYESVALSEERMIQHKLLNVNSASNAIIASLKSTLFEKSDETESHASRMAYFCDSISQELQLNLSSSNELKLLALLHDIGKIGVDDSILKKNGPLTDEEWVKMKLHPYIGFKMASSTSQLDSIAYAIFTHHEWWNGNGYPQGLKGEEIPLNSRILSVVDAFDAMTNNRVYRDAMSIEDAIKELEACKGTQFDPQIVDIFLKIKPSIV